MAGIRHTAPSHEDTLPKHVLVSETFIVFQQTASRMPAEAKREGVCESDVLIAFPVNARGEPLLRDRMTFNFLPIRCYGLPVSHALFVT